MELLQKRRRQLLKWRVLQEYFRYAPDQRNPLLTTTYGVGEIIADAITMGCRHFIIGIGGSATNDGGIGMLQALRLPFFR